MESSNEYELERASRIEQNLLRMQSLGLLASLEEVQRIQKRNSSNSRSFRASQIPVDCHAATARRSSRQQGVRPEAVEPLQDEQDHAAKRVRTEAPRVSFSHGTEEEHDEHNAYRFEGAS